MRKMSLIGLLPSGKWESCACGDDIATIEAQIKDYKKNGNTFYKEVVWFDNPTGRLSFKNAGKSESKPKTGR